MHVLALLAAESDSSSGGSGLFSIGILLLIPVGMYFLMIRPQRRKLRDQQAMQAALEVGDEVLTNAGIYGFITGFEDDVVWVEIDDDVQIRVNRGFLQGRVNATTTAAAAGTDASSAPGGGTGTTTTGGSGSGGRVTPTVKGRKAVTGSEQAETADPVAEADTDAAEPTSKE